MIKANALSVIEGPTRLWTAHRSKRFDHDRAAPRGSSYRSPAGWKARVVSNSKVQQWIAY